MDMEFLFECSTQYITFSPTLTRPLVRYKVEHKKKNSISTSNHVLFCLLYRLYKHTNDNIFDDFQKISKDFFNVPKTRQMFPNIF